MSISHREMESFNQKTHEIMESLKVSQKRLEEMIVALKGPLGAARMNSNTKEIENITEIMDNLKKLQRSMIADSNSLSFIKDDLETAKETSEANTKFREEERKRVDAKKDMADPRGTYRRQRKIEEGNNDCLSNIENESRSEGRHRNHPRQYEGKRDDERRSGDRHRNHQRQYEGAHKDDRRSGGRGNHQRQYEGDREDERRSGGGRRYNQRR